MKPEPFPNEEARPPYPRIVLRAAVRVFFLGLLLFLPAPGAGWPAGWLYLGLYAAWSVLNIVLLARRSPGLLSLREGRRPAASEPWDKAFMFLGGFLLACLLLACSVEAVPQGGFTLVSAAAFFLICAGYALFTWALLSNRFAIGAATLQAGQVPADKGPYAAVRHPIYLAAIVVFICTPAALGSPGGFVPAALLAVLVLARTALEDRLLLRSLPGYGEYAGRVPYRLLPGVW